MPKLGFLFSGQGSQYIGMGKNLYNNFAIAKETYDEASEVLGFDLGKLCFEGNANELSQTENTQPAILTTSMAQFRVYMEEIGEEPHYLAGHSLGEYTALVCAGVIDFSDAVKLVRARGMFMKETANDGLGAMAVIRNIDEKIVEEESYKISLSGRVIGISNYNGEKDVVVSGEAEAVAQVCEELKSKGAEIFKLNVSAAFHSPIMELAADKFKNELNRYAFKDPKYKVLSNVTALSYEDKDQILDILGKQIVKPVNWYAIMKYLEQQQLDNVIEFGPKATLRNLVRNNISNIGAYSYDKEEDIKEMKEEIFAKEVSHRKNRYSIISRSLGIAVATKNNNWNNEEYTRGVIEPYEKIAMLQTELEATNKMPTIDQMQMAVEMLKSVFQTKGTPKDEQQERFNQLFDETNTKHYFENFEI
ncbi:[acyl-carrier-protein] S-malonyltransferase [Bacillus thuringiensis]|uniref:ACP S-malonyltransferase n=1 Tax=Bacillus thuringiensis TaxID=1428 RepID=UPI000BF3D2AC|nr:ACP S-malonyltransferase [Bacillus thuringiensis]PFO43098.1 [acyl-carrier-protein] S-malonyltransferase [Bacillus thuringiensis]